jgi:hypothetical protein
MATIRPRPRRVAARVSALALAALTSAALASGAAASSARPAANRPAAAAGVAGLAGYGEPLAVFEKSYPLDVGDCLATACYGPLVTVNPPTYEFSYLDIERGRVVGYDQAIKSAPLLQAELQVAELFPDDVNANEVQVIRRDQFGAACAVYDLYSKTLKADFGPHAFGNDGDQVGVELATIDKAGTTVYAADHIDLAIVMPIYAGNWINC